MSSRDDNDDLDRILGGPVSEGGWTPRQLDPPFCVRNVVKVGFRV